MPPKSWMSDFLGEHFTFRDVSGLHLRLEPVCDLAEQMDTCVAAEDAVVAVRVREHTEIFVSLNECLRVFRCVAEVYVVVCQSLTEQQVSAQLGRTGNGTYIVALGIFLGRAHEAFRIDGVVVAPAGGRCYGNACGKNRTPLAHAHQGAEAAEAPSPNAYAVFVDVG